MTDDRRHFQRLKLSKPILATMRGQSALILDIGMSGAFIEHYGEAVPGDTFELAFRWQGEDVAFLCVVARTAIVRTPGGDGVHPVSHTGVRFANGDDRSAGRLQDMMATLVGRIIAAQKSNATGDARDAAILADLGGARRARARGYVTYHLRGQTWHRVMTDNPRQPPDGFTVGAYEEEEELETLCRAYEQADEEGRRLIRLVAELSAMPGRR